MQNRGGRVACLGENLMVLFPRLIVVRVLLVLVRNARRRAESAERQLGGNLGHGQRRPAKLNGAGPTVRRLSAAIQANRGFLPTAA